MQRLIRGLCCSYLCRRPGLRWLDRNIYIENNAIMLATRHGITSIRSVINWYFISHLWCSLSGVFLFLTIMIIVRNVKPVSSYRSHSHPLLFELGYLKEKNKQNCSTVWNGMLKSVSRGNSIETLSFQNQTFVSSKKYRYFSYFRTKTYVVGTH